MAYGVGELTRKRKTAKLFSLVVIIAAITVTIGWIFDIRILKSIFLDWGTMQVSTAFSFILSGITLFFIARAQEGEFDKAQVAIFITSLIIILLMGILFFSFFLRVHTGMEDLFTKDKPGVGKTVIPGQPSVITMLNFILIASSGILTMLNPGKLQLKLKIIGIVVAAIGALAVAGYIFNAPLLYYFVEGKNSAMACHTAVLFVLLGIGLVCLLD